MGSTCLCAMSAVDAPTGDDDEFKPITVSASSRGRFATGHSWYASLNSAGQGQLTIDRPDGCVTKPFRVPMAKLNAFQKMVYEERFAFDLKESYGKNVPDGNTQTLTIMHTWGSTTVQLHDLGGPKDWKAMDPKTRSGLARAIHAWMAFRSWINNSEAGDARRSKSFQKMLDMERDSLKPYKPKDAAVKGSANLVMPITLSVSYSDDGLKPGATRWDASINSAGEGQITIRARGKLVRKPIRISPEQLAALRNVLAQHHFFDLKKKEFGGWIPDGGHTKTLTIVKGSQAKTIKIGLLYAEEKTRPAPETYRVLRVWNLVRGWFEDKIPITKYEANW